MVPFIPLAKRLKPMAPLLAAPAALLLNQGQAKAILTYNIYESGTSVVVQASGSLNLSGATSSGTGGCAGNGVINANIALLCSGFDDPTGKVYSITGPDSFNSGKVVIAPASSVSGLLIKLYGQGNLLFLGSSYTSNSPISSSATYNNKTLAGLGFTTTGLIGTWTLTGTSETIQVFLGSPSPSGAAVPGPLPLLGAGAAFGWSRRLRSRIAAPLITPV